MTVNFDEVEEAEIKKPSHPWDVHCPVDSKDFLKDRLYIAEYDMNVHETTIDWLAD